MSLSYFDTFNTYATANIAQRWSAVFGATIIAGGRFSGNYLRFNSASQTVSRTGMAAHAKRAFGLNFRPDAGQTGNRDFRFQDGASTQVQIRITNTLIEAFRSTTTSLGSAAFTFADATWYYVEAEVVISATAGTVKVWVDNVLKLDLSGLNTQATANPTTDGYQLFIATSASMSIDELYFTDGAGSLNVGRLGPRRAVLGVLNGDGVTTAWTRSTGSTNYTLVDEAPVNTTDWVQTDVLNNVDLYTIAALSDVTISSVNGVQVGHFAQETGLTPREIQSVVRTGGSNFNSAALALLGSYFSYLHIWEQNPNTAAAWTQAEIEGAQYGQELTL
jgi:hypothetical protein